MSETTTSKPVNVYQLAQEIGGNPTLRVVGPEPDGTTTVRADIAQATLDAKVASHVADGNVRPPVSAEVTNEQTIRDAARNALATNRAYAQRANPTAAQTTAQVKALSQQQNGIIRLLLGALDATD